MANGTGSFAYTIFDNFGGNSYTKFINLGEIRVHTDQTWSGEMVRWLVRDSAGVWFLSVGATNVPVAGDGNEVTVQVDNLGGWLRADAVAEANMNALNNSPKVPIADPNTLTTQTPDWSQITGGGIYIEVGNLPDDPNSLNFIPDILTWIKRPTAGEQVEFAASDATTSNVIVCPNRPVAMVQMRPVFDPGEWEIALDSISCTLDSNGSGAVEIREVLVYTDPNRDGFLGDGELVARGTVSGDRGVATFLDGAFNITRDDTFDLVYALLFNESAVGSTWDIDIQASDLAVNAAASGAGDSVVLTGSASGSVLVGSISIPTGSASFSRTVLAETWDNVTTATLPEYDVQVLGLSGEVPGADYTWSYSLTNTEVTGMGLRTPSGETKAAGRETDQYTVEPLYWAPASFSHDILTDVVIGENTVVGLDFTLHVTQSYASTDVPFETGFAGVHQVAAFSDFVVILNGSHANDANGNIQMNFYPIRDNQTYAYQIDVDGREADQGNLNVWATEKTLAAFGSPNGISSYEVSLDIAPYDEHRSIVGVNLLDTASSQGDSFVGVIDGRLATLHNVTLTFNSMANALLDSIVLTETTVKEQMTGADSWVLYD